MVHTFTMNGMYFAVDANSGSIHLLDDLSYRLLAKMKEFVSLKTVVKRAGAGFPYPFEEIREAYKEIAALKEEGTLFTEQEDLERESLGVKTSDSIKALCLHVAHDCNLQCGYCFASKGDYKSGRRLMGKDVAFRAVDFLLENAGQRHNIEIDFFGGEPLMNFDVVKEAVFYGREAAAKAGKEFYFTITTNGVLLDDEKIDFINEYMDNIVISIDGRESVHDSIRYDRGGKGTYKRIVPLAKKLVAGRKEKSYFIRGTFTSRNKDFSRDVKHLASLGFREISVEPVVGSGDDLFITENDVQDILCEYGRFAKEYLQLQQKEDCFNFYHFNLDLYEGPCIIKRITACGAGYEYLAVSPEGYLYPCHQFVGQKEFILGDIFNGVTNTEIREDFKRNNILGKEKCRDCWAKLYCSGGCHANAWYSNKDIAVPNEIACILQKKRIECAIMIEASKQRAG